MITEMERYQRGWTTVPDVKSKAIEPEMRRR